ncbi:MAG: hypothetical protein MUE44_20980 [Oscillatoriaceae cyanobacterium Prado104]|nr:hypothetical protein [Oscillatoriaceae cyanobacterium Prado104]
MQGRPSPQSYKNMEQLPDANFYNACVPTWWKQKRPQFFNCGDRKDVIDTYFTLLTLHKEDSTNSYLDPDRLFAIIDLDIQVSAIDNYNFTDTEEIFRDLYEKSEVREQNAKHHRIWITGLIHKEAYFLTPELQPTFDSYLHPPIYQENPAQLTNVYWDMAEAICSDLDLQNNLQRAFDRIKYCSQLDCTEINKFQDSWKKRFKNAVDEDHKNQSIAVLLTVTKAKDYWKKIQPPVEWSRGDRVFREQLSLEIGRFYSEQSSDVKCHIPFFFKTLHEFV